MKTTFTFRKSFPHFVVPVLAVFLTVFGMVGKGYGQDKTYATWTPNSGRIQIGLFAGGGVTGAGNAAIADDTYATMTSQRTVLLAGGDAWLQLKFPTAQPGNAVTFIKVSELSESGLGLNLGQLLGAPNNIIIANLYQNASNGSATSNEGTVIGGTSIETSFIRDNNGDLYLAVSAPQNTVPYNGIRIRLTFPPELNVASTMSMRVHHGFTLSGINCGLGTYTDVGKSTGLSVTLTDVVQNPQNAVDSDPNNYSTISTGTLQVAGSVFQTFYFNGLSAPQDYFKVRFAIGGGSLLDLNLIGSFEIRAYNGNQQVYSQKLQGGLINGVDLLGLLRNGEIVTLPIGPGVPFDRVAVGVNTSVGLSLASSPLRVYSVERYGGANSPVLTCIDPDPIVPPAPTDHMLNQKDCATEVISFDHANFPYNAIDGNNDTYTELEASSGVIVGIGAYNGHVELGFNAIRPAGTTTYVRIDFDNEVLAGLLDGTLGQLANDLVSNLLFGGHYFGVEAKNNGNVVLARSSNAAFSPSHIEAQGSGVVKIVQDKFGKYYVAITPESDYSSIRITERLGAVLGVGEVRNMRVYDACYSTGSEPCEQGFATYSQSGGLTLDLLNIGRPGVADAEYAIDGDPNTSSKISIGALGIAGSIYQYIDFHTLSAETDHFRVKLKMDGGAALSAEVLGSIVVKAFNGDQEVFSQRLRDGLVSDLDLLDLIKAGQILSLPFGPGVPFDRVAVGIESLLGVNVINNPLQVFSVERFKGDKNSTECPDPDLEYPQETTPPFNEKDCGTTVTSFENTNFPLNVVDGRNDTYATLSAGTGVVAGLGAYTSHIELAYPNAIPAGETSYVRIDFEDDMLNSLLGGSLGGALADLAGGLVLGNHYFEVALKDDNGNQIFNASSVDGFSDQNVKVVKDGSGRFYIAVTAAVPYKSVRITHGLAALIGGNNTATMNVYSMCRETEFNPCEQATFTSFDGAGGLTLDLLDISKAGVFNPQYAIDENSSNYSTINIGLAGIGASVYQNIYFKSKSLATDSLRLRVQLNQPGILNADLVGSYRVKLFNGDVEVFNQPLQSSLINNLDLLGLLNSGNTIQLTIAPGVVYDRLQFGLQAVASINTSAPIRFYGVSRISEGCPDPDFLPPPYRSPVCADDLISAEHVDDVQNLFNGNHNSYATIRSDAGVTKYSGHVEFGYGEGVSVPAGTTSYIRIDEDNNLLDALLAGSVANVLTDILNNIVLGNHYFHVIVKDASGNPVVSGSSEDSFTGSTTGMNPNNQIRIVQDKAGRYYLAIKPNVAYSSVRIEDHTDALLLGQNNSINIYGMCYETDFEGCTETFTTSWGGSGLTVGLTGIGDYGVQNADRILDNNNNGDYSEISLGTINIAGSVQQNVQFNKAVDANSVFKIRMAFGTGTLDANVFGRVVVVGYRNGVEVYAQPLDNAVIGNVNLLQLFNNGGSPEEIQVSTDVEVDELAIRLTSLVGVSVVPNIRLYYIQQDCEAIVDDFVAWKSYAVDGDPTITSVKGGEEVTYTIHVRNTSSVDLNGLIVTDSIPAHTSYVDGSGGTLDNNVVVFNDITVAAGETTTVSFKVNVDADLTGVTQISNVALVKTDENDPGEATYPPADNADPVDPDTSGSPGTNIPVDQVSSFIPWKAYKVNDDASITTVSGGEEIEYAIYVRNIGNQALTSVNISDVLPAGTAYVSGGTEAGGVVSFTIPALAVGETSAPQIFTVKVEDNLTGITEIRNVATAVSDEITTPTESTSPIDNENPTEPKDDGSVGTVIDVEPANGLVSWKSLTVNGSTDSTAVRGGETIEYKIYVRNTGNQDLTNVVISDELPAGTTYVSGGSEAGGVVSFTIPTLAAGATAPEQTFIVTVNENLTSITEIRNVATVVSDELTTPIESFPPVDGNPTEPDTTGAPGTVIDVTPVHDIDLSLNGVSNGANSSQAVSGDIITYTVTITNTGNKDLSNVDLVDIIPENTTLASVGDFTQNGDNLELTIPSLGVGETQTYTFTTTVDAIDPTVVTTIDNSVTATYRNEDDTADKSETATHSMPTDCSPIDASNVSLSGADDPICAGGEITLTASFSGLTGADPSGASVKWYDNEDLTGAPLTGLSITVNPIANTTYYVIVEGDGYCFNNPPAQITVTVSPAPETPTISVIGGNPICEGEFTTLSASVDADAYIWFNNGVAIQGETAKTIDVSIAGQYTVVAVNAGGCESNISASVTIEVTARPAQPTVQVDGATEVCEGAEVVLTSSANLGNQWYKDGVEIQGATQQSITVNEAGTYTVIVTDPDSDCSSLASEGIIITINPVPVIIVNGNAAIQVKVGEAAQIPGVTTDPAGLAVTWYDNDGDVTSDLNPTFDTPGIYTYTAIVTNGDCSASATVVITVYDEADCPPLVERVYANTQSWNAILTGDVENPTNAVDGNPQTHATLRTLIGAIGIGSVRQNLMFAQEAAAGTPVTVKFGKELSGVGLITGVSIVGLDANGNPIGAPQNVQGGLLDLLVGDNVAEYTFVPTDNTGPKNYKGVRVIQAALLSLAQNTRVYGAYITQNSTTNDCTPVVPGIKPNVIDVLHGVRDIGLGALSATSSVTNPWNAVDNDSTSYATISRAAAVLNEAFLTVTFKTQSQLNDSIRIITEVPNDPILQLELLRGYTIQRYLGDAPVGEPLDEDSGLLNLKLLGLLGSSQRAAIIVAPTNEPFDRVRISYGSVASVLGNTTNIYDINLKPTINPVVNPDGDLVLCPDELIVLNKVDDCTVYKIFDAADGGNELASADGLSFALPADLAAGEYTFYVQAIRQGCEVGARIPITVIVKPTAVEADLNDILVNGAVPIEPLCLEPNQEVILTASISATSEIINPVFHWYDEAGTALLDGANGTLNLGVLSAGTYTYSVGVSGDNVCETLPENRKVVTFTISNQATDADITVAGEGTNCFGSPVVLTPSATDVNVVNPVFRWYRNADKSVEIVNETIDGVTYAIDPATGILTISGLAIDTDPYTYYVTMTADGYCENELGKEVSVTVSSELDAPTFDTLDQLVCEGEDAVFALTGGSPSVTYKFYDVNGVEVTDVALISHDAAANTIIIHNVTASVSYAVEAHDASGCVSGDRTTITAGVKPVFDEEITVTVNGEIPDTGICTDADGNVVLAASVDASITLTNPVFHWYDGAGVPIAGGENGTLALVLTPGTYTYTVGISSEEYCETPVGDRASVTFTIYEKGRPEDIEILAHPTDICVGEEISFTATFVGSGTVINPVFHWYTTPDLSDTPVNGSTYTPTNLVEGPNTFYVTVSGDNLCEGDAAAAVAVTVNVNAAVLTPQTITDVAISRGQSIVLTATLGDGQVGDPANYELVWVDNGTEHVGVEFTVTPEQTTTYQVFVRSLTGAACVSDPVTVIVTVEDVVDGECLEANAQTNGVNGICLLCGISDAGNAVDGNPDTYATMHRTVNVAGAVWQELIFPNGGKVGDTISLVIGGNNSILDAAILTALRIRSYNGNTANNDGTQAGAILDITLFPGSTDANVLRFVAGADFDRVRIEQFDLIGLLANGVRIYGSSIQLPAPTDILPVDGTEYCQGDEITLSATAAPNTELRWFDSDGNRIGDGATVTTTAPTDKSGELVYSVRAFRLNDAGEVCYGESIPVRLIINDKPEITEQPADLTLASGNTAVFNVVAVGTGLSYQWEQLDGTNWAPLQGETNSTLSLTVPLVPAGTVYIYRVVVSSTTGCDVVSAQATLTVTDQEVDFDKSNLVVTKDNAVANGVDENEVTATLLDAFDNPIANKEVVFTIENVDGTTATATLTTDASGKVPVPVTSILAGQASVTATVDGTAITVGSPAVVTFVAGAVDHDKSNLVVTKDNALADGVDYNEATATIVDANDNPIANQEVVFDITNVDGTTSQQTVTTDAEGKAVVRVSSTQAGTATIAATVDGTPISGSPVRVTFVRPYVLGITKVADQDRVKVGESTSFTVTITNNGPNSIESGKVITLGELPSSGLTINGYEVTSGNGTAIGSGNSATVTTSAVIPVNGTVVVKVTATVASDAPETISNGIQVWGPDKPTTEEPDDEDETPDVPVDRDARLSITKVADQDRVVAGTNTSFTLTITNNGPAEIVSGKVITLTERPGTGVTITGYEVTSGNGTANGSGNTATVTTNTIVPINGTIVVKVTARVATDAPETITNGIIVHGPDKPTTEEPDDEDDTPEIPVDHVANLSITKVADQERVQAGESTTFTVTITNNGPSDILNGKVIQLVELPSEGLTITRYEVTSGNGVAAATGGNNIATVTTNTKVPVGGTITVKITGSVDAEAPAIISNGIQVWGPDKPTTEEPDDEDETPEIPVDYNAPQAVDDETETMSGSPVDINVLANDQATTWPIDVTSVEIVNAPQNGTVTVNTDGTVTYVSDKGYIGTDRFTYNVRDEKGNVSNVANVNIRVIPNPLFIPNVFTPNGDGKNDQFEIVGIEGYDRVELYVFNRWGNEVYNSPNYNNNWDGQNLNEGTYYYLIKLIKDNNVETQKGWVLIKRQ